MADELRLHKDPDEYPLYKPPGPHMIYKRTGEAFAIIPTYRVTVALLKIRHLECTCHQWLWYGIK